MDGSRYPMCGATYAVGEMECPECGETIGENKAEWVDEEEAERAKLGEAVFYVLASSIVTLLVVAVLFLAISRNDFRLP